MTGGGTGAPAGHGTGRAGGHGPDPSDLLAIAAEAAAEAGRLLAAPGPDDRPEVVETKSSPTDVVTEMDRRAEALITDRILAARPGDAILAEESGETRPGAGAQGSAGPGPAVRWIVDPLDGTVNYLYGLSDWAVSIGVEVAGTVVAGVVAAPRRGETFMAVRGQGAWLHRAPWPPCGSAYSEQAASSAVAGEDSGDDGTGVAPAAQPAEVTAAVAGLTAAAGAGVVGAAGPAGAAAAGAGGRVAQPGDGLLRSGAIPLTCNRAVALGQALVGTGFGYEAGRRRIQGVVVGALLPQVRDIRRGGSAAVDLCMVAAGRLDAFYERGLHPWDRAAGGLIAEEAGAKVTGLMGRPAGAGMTVAAGPGLYEELTAVLATLNPERDA